MMKSFLIKKLNLCLYVSLNPDKMIKHKLSGLHILK
jgi:hypothetical protein